MGNRERKLTIKTKDGCWRIIAILVCVIFFASLGARLVDTDLGKLKVEHISFDSRGATISGEIYYPAGTSDRDSLPAVVITHGGWINSSAYRQMGFELARRGFVALMVDAYGNGMSELPVYDERGSGNENQEAFFSTPLGVYDAIQYVKTLNFVDPTRIGLAGHSMGSFRSSYATAMDCFYYSFNDIMINVLHDTFGVEFEENEITLDAAEVAKEKLNADQLEYYTYLSKVNEEMYNTSIKALCNIGMDSWFASQYGYLEAFDPKTVEVAGYEVTRACKCNIAFLCGDFEIQTSHSYNDANTKAGFMTSEDVEYDAWYAIDDINNSSEVLGTIHNTTAEQNETIKAAADARSLRIYTTTENAHSEQYFSVPVVASLVEYFELTLGVESDIEPESQIWPIRSALNCLAMLAMLAMAFPVVGLITKVRFFEPVIAANAPASIRPRVGKGIYALVSVMTVAATFVATLIGCNKYSVFFKGFLADTSIFKLAGGINAGRIFIFLMAIASIAFLAIYAVANKSKNGVTGLAVLNVKQSISSILKAVLVGVIILAVQYALLQSIEYLFDEDFRLWQTAFDEVRPERWFAIFPYFVFLLPCYLLIGAAVNYTADDSIPEWKDTLRTVVVCSLGVWICSAIAQIQFRYFWDGQPFADFLVGYGLNLLVPVTVYIARKMYNITHSIWVGATLNSLLVYWTWVSFNGYEEYCAVQDWLSNILAV